MYTIYRVSYLQTDNSIFALFLVLPNWLVRKQERKYYAFNCVDTDIIDNSDRHTVIYTHIYYLYITHIKHSDKRVKTRQKLLRQRCEQGQLYIGS